MNPTEDPSLRLRLIVTGRVQNVGFRAFVHAAASRLHLTGWVRNLSADQVETVAEGPRMSLEELALQVGRGPHNARVDHTTTESSPATGEFPSFTVRSSR